MSVFRDEVHKLVDKRVSEKIQTIKGVIPEGNIDIKNWSATVLIPNPHGGIHPAAGEQNHPHITLPGVPLPFNGWSIFTGIEALVESGISKLFGLQAGNRPCQVGFHGGNIHFPYIVSMSSHVDRDKESPGVPNRGSVVSSKVSSTASKPVLPPPKGLASAPPTAAQQTATLPPLPDQLISTNPTLPQSTSTLQSGIAETMSNTYTATVKQ